MRFTSLPGWLYCSFGPSASGASDLIIVGHSAKSAAAKKSAQGMVETDPLGVGEACAVNFYFFIFLYHVWIIFVVITILMIDHC